MKTLYAASFNVRLYRSESFNHRTTPLIEWTVTETVNQKENIVRICSTKKEAMQWVAICLQQPSKGA